MTFDNGDFSPRKRYRFLIANRKYLKNDYSIHRFFISIDSVA